MEDVNYIPGDLVEFCGRMQRIENIDNQTTYRVSIRLEHGWFVNKPEEILKFLKPIPLTPAILEANGWETQNKWYYFLGIHRYSIRFLGIDFEHKSPKGNLYVEINGDNVKEIQYCHQLQHLLFGLGLNSELKV